MMRPFEIDRLLEDYGFCKNSDRFRVIDPNECKTINNLFRKWSEGFLFSANASAPLLPIPAAQIRYAPYWVKGTEKTIVVCVVHMEPTSTEATVTLDMREGRVMGHTDHFKWHDC